MVDNPVRRLRKFLGLSQHKFGELIGRSYASIQGYEAGKRVPPDVMEQLKTIAAKHALADLALDLGNEDWPVRRSRTGPRDLYYLLDAIVRSGSQIHLDLATALLEILATKAAQATQPAREKAGPGKP